MATVTDFLKPSSLEHMSTPSEFRLAKNIVANGGVEFEEFGPNRLIAHATGGQRRLVELRATPDGLTYTCTCSSKLTKPCKHVTAVGLAAWAKAHRL